MEKNGEFRTTRNGEVQPVWAMTQLGRWLIESGQLGNYLAGTSRLNNE